MIQKYLEDKRTGPGWTGLKVWGCGPTEPGFWGPGLATKSSDLRLLSKPESENFELLIRVDTSGFEATNFRIETSARNWSLQNSVLPIPDSILLSRFWNRLKRINRNRESIEGIESESFAEESISVKKLIKFSNFFGVFFKFFFPKTLIMYL